MKNLFEIGLSEKELREVIAALMNVEPDQETHEYRQTLAKRLETELWKPFHESVLAGRNMFRAKIRRTL